MRIWLEGFEFILLKKFFAPKIAFTICLINKGYFQITHIMMFVIHKVSVKRCLFDSIPFDETTMGWLAIYKSGLKVFSTTFVLFPAWFTLKKIHNIAGATVQAIGLIAIFSLGTERSKFFSSHNIFAYFTPSTLTWSATESLPFKRCYLCSRKNVFQTFSSS